jgi:hypothetical protein
MTRANRSRLAIAIALGVAVIIWWRARGDGTPALARPDAPHASTSPPPAGPAPAPALASSAPPPVEPEPGAEPVVPLGPDSPPPYPPGSQPLTEGKDPSRTVPEDDPIDSDDPGALHAVFGPRRDVVHPPDPLVLDLAIVDRKGARVAVANPYARFRSERSTPEAGPWFRVSFADDGAHRYTARFTPSAAERDALIGYRVFVEVGFDAPHGLGPRVYGTSMLYTEPPHGHLNGTFTEAVIEGSLIVGVGVTVDAPGRFKVIGSLYGPDGERAIAFAQQAVPLERGERSVPLEFFGKILHDAGVDGPYVLRYVMLFEEHPDRGTYAPGVTIDRAYTTRAYHAKDFSPAPYVPPVDTTPPVTAQSPSQQGKPGPMFGDRSR